MWKKKTEKTKKILGQSNDEMAIMKTPKKIEPSNSFRKYYTYIYVKTFVFVYSYYSYP